MAKSATTTSKDELPSMEEILTKLGLGKDCDRAIKKRFQNLRSDCLSEFLKDHKIGEKSLTDWSDQECKNYEATLAQASSPDRIPKREPVPDAPKEPVPDVPPPDDDIVPPQPLSSKKTPTETELPVKSLTSIRPKQSAKRTAEAELPEAQSRAKSRCSDRNPAVGLPRQREEDEHSLFSGDDEPIYKQLVGRSQRKTRKTDYGLENTGLGESSTDANSDSEKVDRAVSPCREQPELPTPTNAEPAGHETVERENLDEATNNVENDSLQHSASEEQDSIHEEVVCKPLPSDSAKPFPCDRSPFVPESDHEQDPKGRAGIVKDNRTAAALHYESELAIPPCHVPGQAYLPPHTRNISLSSGSMPADLTPDGIDDYSPTTLSTKLSPATEDINPIVLDSDTKGSSARASTDNTKELSCPKIPKNAQLNENPYQSIFDMAPPLKKQLHFDSEHAKKILDSHLRNHAKATSTPIKFSFTVRHSASHADRFTFCPFAFFTTMSLEEFVAALPMEDKHHITGLCIRQYGPITCLRQVYLYNEEVFGNIRDEFIRHIESDIRKARSTGKRLDYEISIEPIVDDY
ncbi:hypothetical protein FLONG3_7485 [Fusarium longipes]|uniref:Uncharacterized protein n=1 Tax=Fusarium longipes TaxID=694270 RepID=A0A395SDS0_9HYPO|nr:hypothetical protein FLONG3_7485 [Fusarium longipes]